MKVIKSISEWQALRSTIPAEKTVGFIATMGCLHDGHASLIKQSVLENDVTVLSIYVNPTQFNDASDFENYSNTFEHDLEIAKACHVDFVFAPEKTAMYPDHHSISVQTDDKISQVLEGEFRPGHFNGMLTVVLKLLLLIRPTIAYFGEKDYQQYELIKKLVHQFFLTCEIKGCAIVRETSGLAMSSRNKRLSKNGLKQAEAFANLFQQYPELSKYNLLAQLKALDIEVEYLEEMGDRAYIAAFVEGVRLIDNIKYQ